VLKQRARELPPPIQMSDALSRNSPKVEGVEPLQANWLAHGRRRIVDVADNFPEECRYVGRYATSIITTPKRESRQCRRNSGCASIRSTASR
jgi:hypothetical protein